jgi:hypothetical protein
MNIKNLLISAAIGAMIITAMANVPILNLVNCLLCVGFWAGAILAVWLYRRFEGSVSLGQGVAIGAVTGLLAGVLGFALSFVGAAGVEAMFNGAVAILPPEATVDMDEATMEFITGPGAILLNLVGVLVNIIFGALGGLIGGAIFRPKTPAAPAAPAVPTV